MYTVQTSPPVFARMETASGTSGNSMHFLSLFFFFTNHKDNKPKTITMSETEEKPKTLLNKVGEKTNDICTINMEGKPIVSDASVEKTDNFLTKTGEFLQKAVDATIFSPHGNHVDGPVASDDALATDSADEVTHPGGHEVEESAYFA